MRIFSAAISLMALLIFSGLHAELMFEDAELQKKFGQAKIRHYLPAIGRQPIGRIAKYKLVQVQTTSCEDISIPSSELDSELKPAILFKSDGCSFLPQVRKAETLGAGMVILINNKNLNFTEINALVKDPAAAKITTPVAIVSEETAQLISLIVKDVSSSPVIRLRVEIMKTEIVRLVSTLRLDDALMFDLLDDLDHYLYKFGELVTISFQLFKKEREDPDRAKIEMVLNCVGSHNALSLLKGFHMNCLNNPDTFDCFSKQSRQFTTENDIKFTQCSKKNEFTAIMNKMNIQTQSTNSFMLINQSVYTGVLKMPNMLQAICGGFLVTPDVCELRDDGFVVNDDTNLLGYNKGGAIVYGVVIQIVTLIVALCLFFVMVAIVLRQIYHKMLQKRYDNVIGSSMTSYQEVRSKPAEEA